MIWGTPILGNQETSIYSTTKLWQFSNLKFLVILRGFQRQRCEQEGQHNEANSGTEWQVGCKFPKRFQLHEWMMDQTNIFWTITFHMWIIYHFPTITPWISGLRWSSPAFAFAFGCALWWPPDRGWSLWNGREFEHGVPQDLPGLWSISINFPYENWYLGRIQHFQKDTYFCWRGR